MADDLEAMLSIEHPLLKVPYVGLNNSFKNGQKLVDREIEVVLKAIKDLQAKSKKINSKIDAKEVRMNSNTVLLSTVLLLLILSWHHRLRNTLSS